MYSQTFCNQMILCLGEAPVLYTCRTVKGIWKHVHVQGVLLNHIEEPCGTFLSISCNGVTGTWHAKAKLNVLMGNGGKRRTFLWDQGKLSLGRAQGNAERGTSRTRKLSSPSDSISHDVTAQLQRRHDTA